MQCVDYAFELVRLQRPSASPEVAQPDLPAHVSSAGSVVRCSDRLMPLLIHAYCTQRLWCIIR